MSLIEEDKSQHKVSLTDESGLDSVETVGDVRASGHDSPEEDQLVPSYITHENGAPKPPSRKWLRRLLICFAIILVVVVVAIGLLYLRLSSGAMSSAVLADKVTQNVTNTLPEGMSFEFDEVSISLDPLRGLLANITNPSLKDAKSGISAKSANVSVGLRASSLLYGSVRIRDVEIEKPFVSAQVASESLRSVQQLDLSGNAPSTGNAAPTLLARVGLELKQLHAFASQILLSGKNLGLRRITLLDGSVALARSRGVQQNYSSINSTITLSENNNSLLAEASGVGTGGSWRLQGSAVPVEEGRGHEIKLALYDVILPEIIPAFGRENFSLRTDVPLQLSMRSKYVGKNNVPTASFDAEIGSAYLYIGEKDLALLDGGQLSLIWSPEQNALSVETAVLRFGDTVMPFLGYIRASENNPLNEVDVRLVSRDTILAPRDVTGVAPLAVELIGMNGRFDLSSRYLSVDAFELRTGESRILGSANVNFQSQFPSMAGAVSVGPIAASKAKQLWPPTLAGGARRWFVRNVEEGEIEGIDVTFAIPAGLVGNRDPKKEFPKEAFSGIMNFSDARVRIFGDLPDLSARTGQLGFDQFGLTASIEEGSAVSPSGELVDVPSAIFRLPVLGPRNPEAQATVSMIGKASDLAEIADVAPLGFMTKRGVPPEAVTGEAVAEVSATFNLSSKINPEEVATTATVRLSDFSSTVPIQDRIISKGDVVVQIDASGTAVRGNAQLDGIDADVNLFLPAGGAPGSKTDIRIVLSDAQRKKLGIDLGEMLTGPTPVEVGEINANGGRPVLVDLAQARLSLPSIGWSKGVGVPAVLSFLLIDTDDTQTLENIKLSGDGFSASGRAELSKSRGLEKLELNRVSLRRGDLAALEIRRTAKTAYLIGINGDQIDVRGLIRAVKKSANNESGGEGIDFAIDGKVKKLAGFGGKIVSDASFSLQTDGSTPTALQLSGSQGRNKAVSASIEGGNGSSWLSFNAQDGGDILAFLDITESVNDGSLSVSASLGRGNAATVGQVVLSDFTVGDSKNLDQLARSVPRNNNQSGTSSVRQFENARMDFTLRNGRLVMDDAQIRGPAMGVTLNGSIDLKASNLRLNGVYVPAYGLNNVFSRIPIVGTIVGGDRNQGLLGVTFRVSGNLSDPLLTVNPISAIAPGIFRRIFEFR
ncbi:MAG: AsmA-like C-terminal domain-containing protein [Hyphomicrobiales bacterium]